MYNDVHVTLLCSSWTSFLPSFHFRNYSWSSQTLEISVNGRNKRMGWKAFLKKRFEKARMTILFVFREGANYLETAAINQSEQSITILMPDQALFVLQRYCRMP
jgi:hypothetical protein